MDIAFVIADGLSATAVNAHAVPLIAAMLTGYGDSRPRIGPVAVIEGGRVAIGDEIGGLLGADLVAVLIGERPGLSAADSLGVYVTWQPAPGAVDASRVAPRYDKVTFRLFQTAELRVDQVFG